MYQPISKASFLEQILPKSSSSGIEWELQATQSSSPTTDPTQSHEYSPESRKIDFGGVSSMIDRTRVDGLTKTRTAGPVGQFQTKLVKPLVPFLSSLYIRAKQILHLAREVRVFHAQSTYIARQPFHLVILLNDTVNTEEGPDDEQHEERNELEDNLIELFDAMKEWGVKVGEDEYAEHRLSIKEQYRQFFKQRFYFHDARDASVDVVYQRSVAYDERTILFRQLRQSCVISSVDIDIGYVSTEDVEGSTKDVTPTAFIETASIGPTIDAVVYQEYIDMATTGLRI
ncbi:hypothetical protein M408DRAFT_10009 [Serendipita vermifera MAFF 305830]|uniref:Uncharacterized protein n=1 Tax=Serendipita vermifera MAFF 305830 TaxID=933852 RepID=A0A0C3ANK7_SERVB|nr:hypothetical protein M408DRAFT_10009 [Serendipita vermifera MAFF 305830]